MLKSKWMRFLPFLPLLLLLLCVNIFGDSANRFTNIADLAVDTMLSGKPAFVPSGNLDERELKYKYICRMPDDVECVIMGGSIVMCVTKADTGEEKFVNLGNSGGVLGDVLAYLCAMKSHGKQKHIRRIILGPSEHWFNKRAMNEVYYRHKPMIPCANYMIDAINGKDTADREIPEPDFSADMFDIFMKNPLFSLSYFQENIRYIAGSFLTRTDIRNQQADNIEDNSRHDGYYYMPDGSLIYSKKKILQNENDVIREAGEHLTDSKALSAYTGHIDQEYRRTFEKLIEYLLARGITVDILLIPRAPALWDKLVTEKYMFFPELEEYLRKIAEKYSLRVTGSYNPHKVGIVNADFYDARHVRRECISKYFDLKRSK